MSWKSSRLSDLCSDIYSGGTPTSSNAAYYGGDIPWLRTQEVTFNRIRETELAITEAGYENSAAKWVPAKSVIVAMYGNSAGRSAISEIPLTTNQACCNLVIDPARADYRFVFYALLLRYEELKGLAKGAAQNNLNASQVKGFEVPIPPRVEEQQRIADMLSTYDDLIENNRRRIVLLEQSARLLYREWFVHLRFPGHEHVKVVDGVPEGWKRKTMADVAETVGGGTPSTAVSAYWDDGEITWFSPTDLTNNDCLALLSSGKKITEAGLKNSSAKMLPPDTILMSSRASIGYFGLHDKPACTNQGFISLIPRDEQYRYYLLYNLMFRKDEIESKAGGTTYKEINKSTFREMTITWPEKALASSFSEFAMDVMQQVRALKRQNEKLAQARDLLLPRLMSGDLLV